MKKVNRIVSIILAVVMCLSARTNSIIKAASISELEEYANVLFMARQGEGNEAYSRLMQSFSNEQGECDYPEYYAGAYINTQGYLVVLTKKITEIEKDSVMEICKNDNIITASAQYSYNELIAIKELISSRASYAMDEESYNCSGYSLSIRDKENKVFIGVEDITNSELIDFLVGDLDEACYEIIEFTPPEDYLDIRPGDYLDVGGGGSAACGAQYTVNGVTHIGFLTAAHVTNGDTTCYVNGEHVGTTIWEQNGGMFDVAFIELIGNHTFTSKVEAGYIKSMSYMTPAAGSVVYKKGNTTGRSSGTVVSGSYDFTTYSAGATRSYTDMILVEDSNAYYGDSGCLVYMINNMELYATGVLKGGGDGTYCATKIANLTTQGIVPIQ